jgi:hypothetical protein
LADGPVNLDNRRGMAAQKATEVRRRLHDVQADQAALRTRREEFERYLLAMPATNWPEAAAKAEYLIRLLADKVEAQDTVRQKLISSSLEELARLAEDSSGCL